MGKQKGSLVSTWLQTIGLDHVVPIFNAAGIVTPTDLAELDVTHYEALGVSEASDRKKLFYLVQRIKMAVDIVEVDDNDDQDNDERNYADESHNNHRYEFQVDDDLQDDFSDKYNEQKRNRRASMSSRRSISSRTKKNRNTLKESHKSKHSRSYTDNQNEEEDYGNYTDEFDEEEEEEEEEFAHNHHHRMLSQGRNNRSHRYEAESDEYSSGDNVPSPPPMKEVRRPKNKKNKNSMFDNETSEISGVRRSTRIAARQQNSHKQHHNDKMMSNKSRRVSSRYDISPSGEVETHLHQDFHNVSEYEDEEDMNRSVLSSASYMYRKKHQRPDFDDERSVQSSRSTHRKSKKSVEKKRNKNNRHTHHDESTAHQVDNDEDKYYRSRKCVGRKQTVRTSNLSRNRLPDDDEDYGNVIQYIDDKHETQSKASYLDESFDSGSKGSFHVELISDGEVSESSKLGMSSSSMNAFLDKPKRPGTSLRKTNSGSPQTSGTGERRTSSGLPRPRKSMHRDEESITSTDFDSQNDTYGGDKSNSSTSKVEGKARRIPINSSQMTQSNSNGPLRRSNLQKPAVQVRGNTNKRLSTIPSERPAPMSPLLTISSVELEQNFIPGPRKVKDYSSGHDSDVASVQSNSSRDSRKSNKKTSSVSRSKDLDDNDSVKSAGQVRSNANDENKINGSNYTQHEKPFRERSRQFPHSPRMRKKSPAKRKSPKRKSIIRSTTTSKATHRDLSPGRNNEQDRYLNSNNSFDSGSQSGNNPLNDSVKMNTSISTTSGPVFVHGIPEDNSWSTQVARLREDNERAYGGPYDMSNEDDNMRIRVVVRKRPMSKKEIKRSGDVDVIHPLQNNGYGKIHVYQAKTRVDLTKEVETLNFAYDNVFNEDANNVQIYEHAIRNLIPGVFERQWASVFAYGQTGSGKTFTMMGSSLTGMKAGNNASNSQSSSNLGLYYLAAQDLFHVASHDKYKHLSVGVSLFEIYGGKLFDLLNSRQPVKCLEDSRGQVCFPGLSEHPISNADELMGIIETGALNRSTGTTSANADSSRSHAVLQLSLRKHVGRKTNVEHGRLTFIDLAGSERGADTSKASRTTRLEGAEINTSLLALKEVIRALATGGSMTHIPFRGSKLTQVLKEGFVGKNSRTVMVACVAPNMTNCEHTLNTLRYADRVKERDADTGKLTAAVAAASRIPQKNIVPFKITRPITAPPGENDLDRTSSRASLIAHANSVENNANHLAQVSSNDIDSIESDYNSIPEVDNDFSQNNDADNTRNNETVSEDEFENIFRSPDKTTLKGKLQDSPFKSNKRTNNLQFDNGHGRDEHTRKYLSKKEAVQPLVATHRSIMTEMLGMVKHEMSIVNYTDADRDTIDEYLHELEQTQEKQLSLIGTLRNALVDYYASRPPNEESGIPTHTFHTDVNTSILLSDDDFEDLRD